MEVDVSWNALLRRIRQTAHAHMSHAAGKENAVSAWHTIGVKSRYLDAFLQKMVNAPMTALIEDL